MGLMKIELIFSDNLDTVGSTILNYLDIKSLNQCKSVNKHFLKYIEGHKSTWIRELEFYMKKSYFETDLQDFWKTIQESDILLEDFKTFVKLVRDYFKDYIGVPPPNVEDFIYGSEERLSFCFGYLDPSDFKIGPMNLNPLCVTIINGWTDLFHTILEQCPSLIHSKSIRGYNPLHVSLEYGNACMTKSILKKVEQDYIDLKALDFSVKYGTFEVFEKIVSVFYDDRNPVLEQKSKTTPLHLACQFWKNDIAIYIVQHLDETNVNPVDKYMQTPLHLAAQNCNVELFKIIANKAKNLNYKDNFGKTPIYYAIFPEGAKLSMELPSYKFFLEKQLELIEFILDFEPPVDLNQSNSNGMTLLHSLAESGDFEIFKKIANKTENINPRNTSGYTPLHYANISIFKYIYENLTSDKYPIALNGDTIAHTAAKRGDTEVLRFLHQQKVALTKDLLSTSLGYGRRETFQYLISILK